MPKVSKVELAVLTELAEAGIELAESASYSEIVGGINQNRVIIREWCDIIFALKKRLDKLPVE